jgi:hypothetical protein
MILITGNSDSSENLTSAALLGGVTGLIRESGAPTGT